jgi:hypothetical protein
MKITPHLPIMVLTCLISYSSGAQSFQNLNFESSTVSVVPTNQFGADVTVAQGLPGWTAYIGGNAVSTIGHNNTSLGGAYIAIEGPQWPSSQILAGNYTALLLGSSAGNPTSAAIGQTAQIPATAHSLNFLLSINSSLQVTFNGQSIPIFETGSASSYVVMAGDLSPFAGQTGQLLFTAQPNGGGLLDNIQFSTSSIPEPTAVSLLVLGTILCLSHSRRNNLS